MLNRFLVFFLCILSLKTSATDGPFFPIDKNKVKILPQRFEYQLIDKDHFRVGDVVMDANQLSVSLRRVDAAEYGLSARWPSGLFRQGDLVLKDNAGKALWRQPFQASLNGGGAYEARGLDTQTLQRLRQSPFFRFCVQREDELTRLFFCSKDLYFNQKGMIQSRDSYRKESFVDINGQIVGSLGAIFLQSRADTIALRAQMLSGATIEINTRMKNVDFKDISTDGKGQHLVIHATGAEPVKSELLVKKDASGWWARIDKNRPVVYLKGEGGIPMRQEFILEGPIHKNSLRLTYASPAVEKTYDSHVDVRLRTDSNISLLPYDRKNSVEKMDDQTWKWELQDLTPQQNNRRYVKVVTHDGQFVAAHDVFRGLRNEVSAHLFLPSAAANIRFDQWLTLRWGWSAQYDSYFSKSSSEPSVSIGSLDAHYRLTPGLHLLDPSHSIFLSYQMLQVGSSNISALGGGVSLMFDSPEKLKSFSDWLLVRFRYPFSGSGGDYTLKTSYAMDVFLKKKSSGSLFWEGGLRYETYTFSATAGDTSFSRVLALGGASWQF